MTYIREQEVGRGGEDGGLRWPVDTAMGDRNSHSLPRPYHKPWLIQNPFCLHWQAFIMCFITKATSNHKQVYTVFHMSNY